MYVDYEVIESAATLIRTALDEMPVEAEAEWRHFDEDQTKALRATLAEVSFADIAVAVRAAADRLIEPSPGDGETRVEAESGC